MPAGRPRRFVLVDPCLRGPGSHPFHYAALVLAAATRQGCDCLLVAHHDCRTPPAGCRMLPVFTHTAYSKYTLAGGLDRLDARGRPPLLPEWPWTIRHAARRRAERVAAFAREIAPALADLAAGDVVLVATASELEAEGLARAVAALRPPRGVGWHVQYHLPILAGFAGDFARQEGRLTAARAALRAAAAAAAPHEVHHHATTEELAAHYARLVPGPVGTLPYPVDVPPRRGRDAAGPLRVACLGDARPEKHSARIAALVAAAADDPQLAGRLRFAVQTNPGYPASSRRPEHVAVTRSLAALARAAAAGAPVDLLGGPLDAAAYDAALAAADVVLLPYDQGRYRNRCSGVVLEALAAGAVPILSGGGWMARQLAAPLAAHAAAIVARSRTLAMRRIDRPRIGRRPLVVECPARSAADGGGPRALLVELAWAEAGLDLAPVRVAVTGGGSRPATVLAAGGPTTAIFPVAAAAADGLRVECTATCGAATAEPATLTLRELVLEGPVPAAAVGLVIDSPDDVPAALRELVLHAGHYLATAAAHADAVCGTAAADAVVRRLLA
jgi:glycosyltransferase involved in cell wall biosynthesis